MRKDGWFRRPLAWIEPRAPGLHDFLTTHEKPKPAIREALGGFLVILLLVSVLWGTTGQPLNRSPVVVIESGSMMRCDQGLHAGIASSTCDGPFGRIGTIDPGDLIFVKDTDGGHDVQSAAACLAADDRERYGACGDTIIYRPGGSKLTTPIIHRAMLFIVPYPGDQFDVPDCDLAGVSRASIMADACVRAAFPSHILSGLDNVLSRYAQDHAYQNLGPAAAGFVTLGDNNPGIDQGSSILGGDWSVIRPDWVLGKARGELPWLGLLKLWVSDATSGTHNFANAPGDTKGMMWISLIILIGGPTAYETLVKRRRAMRDDE